MKANNTEIRQKIEAALNAENIAPAEKVVRLTKKLQDVFEESRNVNTGSREKPKRRLPEIIQTARQASNDADAIFKAMAENHSGVNFRIPTSKNLKRVLNMA